ncbi:MAG: hypothetical protein HOP23_00810 [Methylococcaceae bacterium]|nr:hypothetical protein [Methylococcaceae bacterium]
MNILSKYGLSASILLLLTACTHYPTQSGYYPNTGGYDDGYRSYGGWQRNYYGSPGYYNYDSGRSGHIHNYRQQPFYPTPPRRDHEDRRQQQRPEGHGYNPHQGGRDRGPDNAWQPRQAAQPQGEHRPRQRPEGWNRPSGSNPSQQSGRDRGAGSNGPANQGAQPAPPQIDHVRGGNDHGGGGAHQDRGSNKPGQDNHRRRDHDRD